MSITVVSDGTSSGTRVYDSNGNEIENVSYVSFSAFAGDPISVDLEIRAPILSVKGKLETVKVNCPVCESEIVSHECPGPKTMGGR